MKKVITIVTIGVVLLWLLFEMLFINIFVNSLELNKLFKSNNAIDIITFIVASLFLSFLMYLIWLLIYNSIKDHYESKEKNPE